MRNVSPTELADALGPDPKVFARLDVTDPDGAWKDVTALGAGALDYFIDAALADNLDDLTLDFGATVVRAEGPTKSLAPLMQASLLNRNAAAVYAPFLDVARFWRIRIAVQSNPLATPTYRELATGVVDDLLDQVDAGTISLAGRGMEALLLDIDIAAATYGNDASPVAMETVIQQMIDDTLGAGVYTLYTPVSPAFGMVQWNQEPMSLMEAISAVANDAGFVVRFRYDASDVLRLTLFRPNRAPTSHDWTLGPTQYSTIPRVALRIAGVRNFVPVTYKSPTLGLQTVQSPTSGTSASIVRYRKRALPIQLAPQTRIVTAVKAQAFADDVRSDLEYPWLEQSVVIDGAWFVEVYDFGQMLANGVHYDVDQDIGAASWTMRLTDDRLTATIEGKAKPIGRYTTWLDIPATPVAPRPTVLSSSATFQETAFLFTTFASVEFVCTVDDLTQSLQVDLYSDAALTTLIDSETLNATSVAPATGFLDGIGGLPRGVVYYAKFTPYSGPLDLSSLPTGTAGEPAFANTSVLPGPTDTPTASYDLSVLGQVKVNVGPPVFATLASVSGTTTWATNGERLNNATLTIDEDSVLDITGLVAGAEGYLEVTQDGTGGWFLTLPSGTIVGATVAIGLTPGKMTAIAFSYNGTSLTFVLAKES
jgi:hypothetical protein